MQNELTKKMNSAAIVIMVSNFFGGAAFIISGVIFKVNLLIIGGVFVIIAGVAFKFIINHLLSKIKRNSNGNSQ